MSETVSINRRAAFARALKTAKFHLEGATDGDKALSAVSLMLAAHLIADEIGAEVGDLNAICEEILREAVAAAAKKKGPIQ